MCACVCEVTGGGGGPVGEQQSSQYERKSWIGAVTLSAAGKREGGKRDGWTPLSRSLQENCLGYFTSPASCSGGISFCFYRLFLNNT